MTKIAKADAQSKPLQWFRMYAEFATDPKVQMLSETDQRRFVMLLCLRCGNGDVTLHDDEVAFQLRISVEDWAATKRTLIAKGLINTANQPTQWDKRQYKSDRSNERVSRFRQRKKQQAVNGCNVTVTPSETETESEKETDISVLQTDIGAEDRIFLKDGVMSLIARGNNSELYKRRAEGLGLDIDEIVSIVNDAKPKNREAYFATICKNQLKDKLGERVPDHLLHQAICSRKNQEAFSLVSQALLEVA